MHIVYLIYLLSNDVAGLLSLLEQCFHESLPHPQYGYFLHILSENVHMNVWPKGQNPYVVHVWL